MINSKIKALFKKAIDSISDKDLEEYIESQDVKNSSSVELVKQFEEEQMIAIEPLYINVGKADAHGDGITDEELDKFVDNFNDNIDNIPGNIHHNFDTQGFYPLKAYRLPMDVYVGDPSSPSDMIMIEEGQPVVKMQFVDKELWEMRKSGVLGGVSIGAKARRVDNPDYIQE